MMFEAVPMVSSGSLFFSMLFEIFINVKISDPKSTKTTAERQITAIKSPINSLFYSTAVFDVSAAVSDASDV